MNIQPDRTPCCSLEVLGNGSLFFPRNLLRTSAKAAEVVHDLCNYTRFLCFISLLDSTILHNSGDRTLVSKLAYGPGKEVFDFSEKISEAEFINNQAVYSVGLAISSVVGSIITARLAQLCHRVADDCVIQPRRVQCVEVPVSSECKEQTAAV